MRVAAEAAVELQDRTGMDWWLEQVHLPKDLPSLQRRLLEELMLNRQMQHDLQAGQRLMP
jgi:hypothetical protein